EKQGVVQAELLLIDVEAIVIYGNSQLTTQASRVLMERGIDIYYLTQKGRLCGKTTGYFNRNIFLKMAQYETYQQHRLEFATAFVRGKLCNQLSVIKRSKWGEKNERAAFETLIKETLNAVTLAKSVNVLYGLEGNTAKMYFRLMNQGIKDFDSVKRTKRPAHDPVNALLNLGYTLLNNDILTLLETAGFETSLGFLHNLQYGRASLACDIIEEFRAPVIDRLVVSLFNNKRLKGEDFQNEVSGCCLKKEGFVAFIKAYEEQSQKFMKNIKEQVMKLKKAILEKGIYTTWSLEENTSFVMI
ncbi:MAG: CRISPR-associated endonuclease Cas1, partial [Eubacterium sp.]